MSDAEYREILKAQTGKASCVQMTLGELFRVEHYLRNTMGWKTRPNTKGRRQSPIDPQQRPQQKDHGR